MEIKRCLNKKEDNKLRRASSLGKSSNEKGSYKFYGTSNKIVAEFFEDSCQEKDMNSKKSNSNSNDEEIFQNNSSFNIIMEYEEKRKEKKSETKKAHNLNLNEIENGIEERENLLIPEENKHFPNEAIPDFAHLIKFKPIGKKNLNFIHNNSRIQTIISSFIPRRPKIQHTSPTYD